MTGRRGHMKKNIAEVLRYQILVLLYQAEPRAEFRKCWDAELQKLKNPELLQALEGHAAHSTAL